MPRFPACTNVETAPRAQLELCAREALLAYLSARLPGTVRLAEASYDDCAITVFTVDADGSIADVRPARDPPGHLGEQLVPIISGMPPWLPGRQSGRPVKTRVVLPLRVTPR